ncbi:hypothetical protein PFISCL1PPCAC_17415, partial [Pristionchus fissidentatus]
STSKRKRRSNGEGHATPTKRRRSSNGHQPRPKSRNESARPATVPAKSVVSSQPSTSTEKEKRKHRPRCHQLCADAADKITKALRSSPCPIGHLFKSADDDGMPYALLSDIVPVLSIPPRILTLPSDKLPLLNGSEHVFQMALNTSGQFIVKYAPVEFAIEEATVYLDRLPYPCSRRLLEKLCTKYGTAVDIRIPIRTPAPLKTARLPTVANRKGTQHRGFAFVQFACKEEAEAICKEFALNHPTVPHSRNRWFFNRGHRRHMGHHTTKFAALTALRHARLLRLKVKLEKALRRKLMLRQWRKEWRERKRTMIRERRKKRKMREKLRKAGKPAENKPEEPPKKSKQEKRKEANKRKKKRLSDLKKQAKQLLGLKPGQGMAESGSESGMECSDGEEDKSLNGQPASSSASRDTTVKGENGEREEGDPRREKRKRRCKRTEIRRSIASHFIDVQAMTFREYLDMRQEYLRLRAEAELREKEEMGEYRASNSNHKREEYREAKWSLRTEEEDVEEK